MSNSLRLTFLFCISLYVPVIVAQAADNKALPVASPVALPAFLDVITFDVRTVGENHKVVVTTSPSLQRLDEPDDRYSVIYDPKTEHYIGLEHGNYTYWEFSWPEVRTAVENSKRYETRLQELNNEGMNGDVPSPTSTNAAASQPGSIDSDDSGYVWRPTTDKKRIAGVDCVRWTGDTVSGESVEAWCYAGPLPKIQAAISFLRAINGPMSLVPVRTVAPDLIFAVYDGLVKGGVTPVVITWGSDQDKNQFAFVGAKTREGKASVFTVPKLYVKTTLITMDGIINQKK
jgi:hypothetical protein